MPRKIYAPDKDAFARILKDQLVQELGQTPTRKKLEQTVRRHAGTLSWLGKARSRQIQADVEKATGLSK